MSIYRYLLHIAYMGKSFRGAQRQAKGTFPRIDDPLTVQGRLEMALKQLKPLNEPVVALSSRTDSGVHAINATCHVDLHRTNGMMYDPRSVTICLNRYFKKEDLPIRILKTHVVPEMFHSRHHAISRTYLYRMMIAKVDKLNVAPNADYIPIEEWDRCLFYCTDTFNIELMKEAASLLEGYHDFRTFMGKHLGSDEKDTRRVLDYIIINKANKFGYSNDFSWPASMRINVEDYLFLDIYLKSRSFLYKQVRRMVASLVAVAQDKITLKDIQLMLEIPSHQSWCPQIKTLPPHGLYLCQVEYSKDDWDTFVSSIKV